MDIVNLAIITLADLDLVDSKINEVQGLIDEQNQQALSKLNNTFEDGKTTKVVANVIEKLSSLPLDDPQTSIDLLNDLRKENDLSVYEQLSRLYQTKLQAVVDGEFLEIAESVENEVDGLGKEIEECQKVFDAISGLNGSNVSPALYSQVISSLKDSFGVKIDDLRQDLSHQLSSELKTINWLGHKFTSESFFGGDLGKLNELIASLVSLQIINNQPIYPNTWWVMDILIEPFITRFNFHFNTKKDTNKLLKPEWVFEFVEKFITENLKLFEIVVNQAFTPHKLIMVHQLITSVLVPVRDKITGSIGILNDRIEDFKTHDSVNYDKCGRLLSHLVFELTSFDQRLRNSYHYNPFVADIDQVPSKRWMGLTADVLLQGDTERLGTTNWLNFESLLANKRFQSEIIEDVTGLSIDVDYRDETSDSTNLKPTYSALNLVKLFNNLTNHYRSMKMVKFQLKYVSTIQLRLLENYHDYLHQKLKKFDDVYNLINVLSLIPGSIDTKNGPDTSQISESLKGLETLTQIFCSSQFILQSLEEWSEDLIFIQLWNAYKTVANRQYKKDINLFQPSIDQYKNLNNEIRKRYSSFFHKGIKDYLKDYINTSQWEISTVKDNASHFVPLITSLPTYLSYLQKMLCPTEYYIIVNDILSSICQLWYEYIITNNRFTKAGAQQLKQDFSFITSKLSPELNLDSSVYSTENNYSYVKVLQSTKLLQKYDSRLAKSLIKANKVSEAREEFEDSLCNLSEDDIKEILYRIA